MIKNRCNKLVFCKHLNKSFPCHRIKGHGRKHSANLAGFRLQHGVVVCLGKPLRRKNGKSDATWIVRFDDNQTKQIRAMCIIDGTSSAKKLSGTYMSRNGKKSPERNTVYNYYRMIFKEKGKYPTYKNMPFFSDWNPDKGGAFWKGAKWIVDNLGARPAKGWTVDIINHSVGFVPSNLRWAQKTTQQRNQQHRILGQFTDVEFRTEARRRGYNLVPI